MPEPAADRTAGSSAPRPTVVRQLVLRPVKSLAGVEVGDALVERAGLAGDRRWMVVDPGGEVVTARELHALLGVRAAPAPGGILLSSSGLDDLLVLEPREAALVPVGLSRLESARPAGREADAWLAVATGADGVRLVWLDDPSRRSVSAAHGGRQGEPLNLSDAGPIHLTTTASLAALNDWLVEAGESPIPMERFRPSIVVDGDLEPFAEDAWASVRIGDVRLRFSEHCDRCVLTTIDLESLRTTKEPVRTLARHRRHGGNVWFGIRLVPETTGRIAVGDPVVVETAEGVVGEFPLTPVLLP
ncbi:MOSC domain-containing protein [Cellulomonas massiliensis]|uniref:MOSC domain-containing protein n=1 Tax=Cellulomonas massiliensis TaxID=1465811 RepID=UPI0002DCCCCB|nr:MOSC domain-containing protein [Cellulomonas massiliensis]